MAAHLHRMSSVVRRDVYRLCLGRWQLPGASLLCSLAENNHRRQFYSNPHNTTRNVNSRWWQRAKLLCATAGSCIFLGISLQSTAFCSSKRPSSTLTSAVTNLPELTFYQYRTCPFCCKARAYLDFYSIPYTTVEVNPLFKKEIKFSEYKKVPFIVAKDGLQINDSTLLISVFQTFLCNGGSESLASILEKYPEVSYTDAKGKTQTERANKYFIMFGERGDSEGISLAERREEREWREWVDTKLIHALSPNIYRTLSESLEAFDYISRVGNFSTVERWGAKYVGAFSMYFLSKMLKKKYQLREDVRESLYEFCREWMRAVGKDRKFMGGSNPNLADLAVYGVLSSIEGLRAFKDMMEHTNLGMWYWPMKRLVNKQDQ